tara:strand:+ start:668 stop:1138 length:471 start_codon:yes stop_codon:yes gene_type:complete
MAYQKLQVSQGLAVIPSDTVLIPDPAVQVLTGTADFSVASTLTDVGTTFLSDGISYEAIVYNTTVPRAYDVTAVTDDLNLALSPATTGGATDVYVLYNAPTSGCVLYVGVAGDVKVKMAGGNDVVFKTVAAGSFLPINVIQVFATGTTATDIVALW